jgi:plastocyanin
MDVPRTRTTPTTDAALPAPKVPLALDGGLGYDDLARKPDITILVQVGPWPDFQDGDILQILWGSGEAIVLTQPCKKTDADKVLDLFVPSRSIQNLRDGNHPVKVRVSHTLGQTVTSLPINVRVKLKVPGGHDTEAHTPYANENLAASVVSPEVVDASTTEALVSIFDAARGIPYENIAEGDLITVRWNIEGNDILYGPLTAAEAASIDPLVITIDRAALDAGGVGEAVKVTYQIYDTVLNWSLWSPYTAVEVVDPNARPAPWVEGTVDDAGRVLDLATLGSGDVTVLVEGSGALKDDEVTAHWGGTTASGLPVTTYHTPPQTPTRPSQTLTFTVPNDQVTPLAQGNARAWYTIAPALGGAERSSARRNLAVTGELTQFRAPDVAEARGNTLDPTDLTGEAHATVFAWTGMQVGDEVDLIGEGKTSGGASTFWHELRSVDSTVVDHDLPFAIPKDVFLALLDGSLHLYYTVTPFGTARNARKGGRVQRSALAALRSEALDLLIRDASAQPLLMAPSIDELVDGVLPEDAPLAHVNIPAYLDITAKERVDLAIRGGSVPFDSYLPVTSPAKPPVFTLQAAFISANRDQALTATYTVTRNDGSLESSHPLPFRIGVAGSGALAAPTIAEANGAILDPLTAANGATVVTPADADLQPGDTVTATFGSYTTAPEVAGKLVMRFVIPPAEILRATGTSVAVFYTRTRNSAPQDSAPLELQVSDIQDNDPKVTAPVFVEADGTLILDLATFDGDPTVSVAAWPLMAVGQRFWLSVVGSGINWPIAAGEGVVTVGDFTRTLDRRLLEDLADGTRMRFTLKIAFDGNSNEELANSFQSLAYTLSVRRLSAPTVDQNVGGQVSAASVATGMTVRIPADTEIAPTDTIRFVMVGNGVAGSYTSDAFSGTTRLHVIPASHFGWNFDRTITVSYEVIHGGKTTVSPDLDLLVSGFADGATELPTPSVVEALDAILDLGTFAGDAHGTLSPWPLMAANQRLWIHLVVEGGSTTTLVDAHAIQGTEVGATYAFGLPRAVLTVLADGAKLEIRAGVTFDGSTSPADKIQFPVVSLTLVAERKIFREDFTKQPARKIEQGQSVVLNTMKVTNWGMYGLVEFWRDGVAGLVTGSPGGITGGVARLDLNTPARSVSIYPGVFQGVGQSVTFYSEGDIILHRENIPVGSSEVTFTATGVLPILRVDLDGYHMGGLRVNAVEYAI